MLGAVSKLPRPPLCILQPLSPNLEILRGDLGVELELERVPFAQKLLIARAKKAQLRLRGLGCLIADD